MDRLLLASERDEACRLPTGPTKLAVAFHKVWMVLIIKLFETGMAAGYACWGVTILSFSALYALLRGLGCAQALSVD